MLRITESISFFDGAQYVKGFCVADDVSELPTDNIATGSSVKAVDTGAEYFFDEVSGNWAVPTE